MGNWRSRDVKLRQRQMHKDFSKPFKKKPDKNKQAVQRKIRAAQRAKYTSLDEDDEIQYE